MGLLMRAGMLVRYLEMIRILLQCALDGGIQSQLSSHRILLLVRFYNRDIYRWEFRTSSDNHDLDTRRLGC